MHLRKACMKKITDYFRKIIAIQKDYFGEYSREIAVRNLHLMQTVGYAGTIVYLLYYAFTKLFFQTIDDISAVRPDHPCIDSFPSPFENSALGRKYQHEGNLKGYIAVLYHVDALCDHHERFSASRCAFRVLPVVSAHGPSAVHPARLSAFDHDRLKLDPVLPACIDFQVLRVLAARTF